MNIGGKARNAIVGVTVFSLGVLTADVFAGGAKIPDQSTRAMGMMDAFAAGADDASAVYYNPAGLTSLRAPEVITNLYFAHANVSSDGPGGNDTSDGKIFTIPNLYLATPVKPVPGLAAGFGVYTPFGLGSRWSQEVADKWAGLKAGGFGQATRESEIQLMDFNPAVAYSPVKCLSLGAGVDYYRSKVIQRFSQNYAGFGFGESELEATGDGWGYNLGAQLACTDAVKLGLTYRSAFVINYDGSANYRAVPLGWAAPEAAVDAKAKLRYPQSVTGGVNWQVPETKLRLEADVEWMDWSEWDRSKVTVSGHPLFPPGTPVSYNTSEWQDSWILMLGAEYEYSERWTLRCGYAWNQTCVPRERADVDLPTGDTHAIAVGAGYRVTSQLSLDAAVIVAYGTAHKLDNSSAPAGSTFDAISTYASVGATYRF